MGGSLLFVFIVYSVLINTFVIGFQKHLTFYENLHEDMYLDSIDLMTKYGYTGEKHSVVTEDGYILELHHLKRKKYLKNIIINKHPVFFMHGMTCSSFNWLSTGPGKALPYILHDLGFDVWLGNERGNIYSRNHIKLNTSDPKFFKFSWHEIGYYDLPASIDYILKSTSSSSLHYIGHSQGCTTFFVLTSMRPEYNLKIQTMNAFAPPVFMSYENDLQEYSIPLSFQSYLDKFLDNCNDVDSLLLSTMRESFYYLCRDYPLFYEICKGLLYYGSGRNGDVLLNKTLIPLLTSHSPGGKYIFQVCHYMQLWSRKTFAQYDHGMKKNMMLYGSKNPPEYPLGKVTAKIALHYGNNDLLIPLPTVKILQSKLQNVVFSRKVPNPNFNHCDFLFAVNVTSDVYNSVVSVIMKYD